MIYNNKKHFYDPYDSLDAEWKAKISHEMLSVGEAARLSGFSRQHINKLIANGIIDAKKSNDGNYVITWKKLSDVFRLFQLHQPPLSVMQVTL